MLAKFCEILKRKSGFQTKEHVSFNPILKERLLKVISIEKIVHYSGIPLPANGKALAQTLEMFAFGIDSSFVQSLDVELVNFLSGKTSEKKTVKKNVIWSSNTFINTIVNEVIYAFSRGSNCWTNSYDYHYGGPAKFHKKAVKVLFDRANKKFILFLHGSYVGNECETELAKELNIQQGIYEAGVKLHLPKMKNDLYLPLEKRERYELNCKSIAEMLVEVISVSDTMNKKNKRTKISIEEMGKQIASSLLETSNRYYDKGRFVVQLGRNIQLSIVLKGGQRFVYKPGEEGSAKPLDVYQREGSCILLPFPTNYTMNQPVYNYGMPREQIEGYTLIASMTKGSPDQYDRLPIYEEDELKIVADTIESLVRQCNND